MPTFTDRLGSNYLANPVKTLDDYQGDIRIDHNFSNNDRFFGRFSAERGRAVPPDRTAGFRRDRRLRQQPDVQDPTPITSRCHRRTCSATTSSTSSPPATTGSSTTSRRLATARTSHGQLGIPGANLGTDETSSLTRMTFQNFVGIGDRGFSPFQGGTNVFHYTDTLTMVKGSHQLNMGGTVRAMQLNLLGDTALAGQFAFTPFFTAGFTSGRRAERRHRQFDRQPAAWPPRIRRPQRPVERIGQGTAMEGVPRVRRRQLASEQTASR